MSLLRRVAGTYEEVDYSGLYRRTGGTYIFADEVLRRVSGIYQQVWRKDGPPPDPTGVGSVAANGLSVTTSWTWPANAEADYDKARVERRTYPGGAWGTMIQTSYPTASQARIDHTNGVQYQYRVQFVDLAGNASEWVEAAAVTAFNGAPATPTISVPASSWSGGNFTVTVGSISSPYNDVSNVSIYRRGVGGGAWTLVHSAAYTAASIAPAIAQLGYDTYHEFYATVTCPGGTATSAIATVYSRPSPGTIKYVNAVSAQTFLSDDGFWAPSGYAVYNRAAQGAWDPSSSRHTGCWFYGTGIVDACRGHIPSAAQIYMMRSGSLGTTGTAQLWGHGYTTKPAGSPGTGIAGTNITTVENFNGTDATAWETLTLGHRSSMTDGTIKGFLVYTASTTSYPRVFKGPVRDDASAGQIALTF
jgi:hypothetical protein